MIHMAFKTPRQRKAVMAKLKSGTPINISALKDIELAKYMYTRAMVLESLQIGNKAMGKEFREAGDTVMGRLDGRQRQVVDDYMKSLRIKEYKKERQPKPKGLWTRYVDESDKKYW